MNAKPNFTETSIHLVTFQPSFNHSPVCTNTSCTSQDIMKWYIDQKVEQLGRYTASHSSCYSSDNNVAAATAVSNRPNRLIHWHHSDNTSHNSL